MNRYRQTEKSGILQNDENPRYIMIAPAGKA
jgi:hypothetical protein